jgi:hypothetical protein
VSGGLCRADGDSYGGDVSGGLADVQPRLRGPRETRRHRRRSSGPRAGPQPESGCAGRHRGWQQLSGRLGGSSSPANAVDIYGARVRANDGTVLDPDGFPIAASGPSEKNPAVAFDGTNYLALWTEPAGLFASRVRASDHQILDTPPIQLDTSAGRPAVVHDGTDFIAVWQVGTTLRYRHVRSTDGSLVEGAPQILRDSADVTGGGADPALARDGNNLLVTWRGTALLALRFDKTGTTLGTPVVIDPAPGFSASTTNQAVSVAEGKYFLAWDQLSGLQPDEFNELQAFVRGTTLAVTGGGAAPAVSLARVGPRQTSPSISFDGRHHLVVWHEFNGSRFEIRAARLRHNDGVLLDTHGLDISGALPAISSMAVRLRTGAIT